MAEYYLKRLMHQEMGSPTMDADGTYRIHRGRYMLITNNVVSYFPHLSSILLNDCTALSIKPYYSDSIVYAQYVYHNSKLIPAEQKTGVSNRNERRIYLNDELDACKEFFHPDDIVVFRKSESDVYLMDIYSPSDAEKYGYLDNILQGSTSVIHDGEIPFFRETSVQRESTIKDKKVFDAIDVQQRQVLARTGQEQQSMEDMMGANLFNSRTFRDFVMLAYNNKCAVTRSSIHCYDLINLEAAHIKPQAHDGTFLPCNGIAMSRDMHFAFDKGFFTIMPDYTIKVHEDVLKTDSYLNQYNRQMIYVPQIDFFKPNEMFLNHHRKHIFGTFRQIRQLSFI